MIVKISRTDNLYKENYYQLEVVVAREGLTKEQYQAIKEAMQKIVSIMRPKIYRERQRAKKKEIAN